MEIRFVRDGVGTRRVPVVYMLGWRQVSGGMNVASFRPGWGTLPYRLIALAMGVVLMAMTHFMLQPLMTPAAGMDPIPEAFSWEEVERANAGVIEFLDAETRAELEAEFIERQEARVADHARYRAQSDTVRTTASVAYTGLMVLFGVLGLLPVVSLAWNRLSFWADAAGNLKIHRWGVFPKTHTIPLARLGGIRVSARQHIERRGAKYGSVPMPAGWRWRVRLDSNAGGVAAEFVLHHQKDRPLEGARPPEPVRRFMESLQRITGLQCAPPVIEDDPRFAADPPGVRGESVRVHRDSYTTSISLDDPAALDELPPDIRARVEAAMRGEHAGVEVHHEQVYSITVHDAAGKVHHYNSPEEMPPDLRALYERARGEDGPSVSKPWE